MKYYAGVLNGELVPYPEPMILPNKKKMKALAKTNGWDAYAVEIIVLGKV